MTVFGFTILSSLAAVSDRIKAVCLVRVQGSSSPTIELLILVSHHSSSVTSFKSSKLPVSVAIFLALKVAVTFFLRSLLCHRPFRFRAVLTLFVIRFRLRSRLPFLQVPVASRDCFELRRLRFAQFQAPV